MQLSKVSYALIAAGVMGGVVTFYNQVQSPVGNAFAAAQPTIAAPAVATTAAANLPDFTALVDRAGTSVVNIAVVHAKGKGGADADDIDEDSPYYEFFKRFGGVPNGPGMRPQPQQPSQGMGSGFIVSPDGYIVTNAHVVDGASEVTVKLTDRREFIAKVIGADKRTDIALIKIEAKNLPALDMAAKTGVKRGEWVIAIGSPFGLESTVTAGIVSAKSRDTGDLVKLIQTDVAINPGNSGGPLINMRGEVVGINSQIYSRSGGYMGISFAIPIDEAVRVSDSLRTKGRVERGRIGVAIDQVTKDVAESIGLGKPVGALVRNVEAGGPAEKAGVEAGDIITKVDGRAVEKSSDLPRMVGMTKPGSKVALQVFRRGQYRDISVTVVDFEPEKAASSGSAPRDPAKPPAAPSALGLTVADLTDAQRRDLKVKSGVRVETVDGAAARAGVREGDVLLSIDNAEITSTKQFDAVVAKLDKARAVTVLVRRGDAVNFLIIKPGK